ncbi:MAG: ADP-ribosylglycohydrolase family protein [Muribaculaceae bacterium]|nr:ADP-ribosylglycohydrolase family protein [Muribaculaceae bacterium]
MKNHYKKEENLNNRYLGSLIGGACGDALGYAVEFNSLTAIQRRYPGRGITEYELDQRGLAPVSDDTQMSLFSLEGMHRATQGGAFSPDDFVPFLTESYLDWYATQTEPFHHIPGSRLSEIKGLWEQRAPGNTCMSALRELKKVDRAEVRNNSKGCGGVMRVAPIAIYSHALLHLTAKETAILAGLAAEITHKHPLSTCASAALTLLIYSIFNFDRDIENINREWLRNLIRLVMYEIRDCSYGAAATDTLENLLNRAMDLAESDISDTAGIALLGEGWVAEETLAIALFSVMRYIDDFEKCIVCSVNHDGDSDSTGAVAGNIIGALLGYTKIPEKYITNLEFAPEITSIAETILFDNYYSL